MRITHSKKFSKWNWPNRKLGFWLIALAIILMFAVVRQCHFAPEKSHQLLPIPVSISSAVTADVPIYLNGLGGVTPTYSVTVRTQINGTLQQVLFHEGQMVKAGDVLAQIDPRPYQALLIQYQGQLDRDQALLANALVDLKRYQTLWKQDSVAQQTLATQQALVKQYKGAVQIDKGLIETARINLIYCRITSPIDGRVGLRLIDPGNFVQISDTSGIAVINMLNPITVIFTIPEDSIPDIMQSIFSGNSLQVEAYDRDQHNKLASGKTITIDNQIDPATGTVKIKAVFDNENNKLYPGQFVNIRLLAKTLHNVITIPTTAVQFHDKESFVYVLNNDQTVSIKHILIGANTKKDTIVTSGIVAGQKVVVEGADKLSDGTKVIITQQTKKSQSIQKTVSLNQVGNHFPQTLLEENIL